jgi:hypothetical protein
MLRTVCILVALYCLAFLCSCNKDSSNPPVGDPVGGGVGYIPLTAGTFWVYQDSVTSEYDTATVLSDQVTQNNITYTKVSLISATDTSYSYYGIKDHNYYLNGEQSGMTLTMLVLNDTASVGYSWVDNMGTVNGAQVKGTGTIIEKLNTFTVQSVAFSDVIHTRYVLSANLVGTNADVATYDFYFAKGKGIIKIHANITDILGGGNNIVTAQDLVNYSIK